ncbi:unnamed protein product [Echinostoma caproni]|uniref:Reverse transcriptase domain-containing protein n=1 Tax=Echinostoma caproni TaxID=27848 RepID=A0A183A8E2_9TREM|nr:unnamed protein product [Echinostoma caproni]
MEAIVADLLMEYLEKHELLSPTQHGSRHKRSSNTNLLLARNEWTKSVDTVQPLDIVYLDFSKAFDRVVGQFPAVCAKNLTTSLPAVCCPIPVGSTEPCGGPGRGLCREALPISEDLDLFPVEEPFLLDDRLAWPTRFLRAVCACQVGAEYLSDVTLVDIQPVLIVNV